MNRIQTYKIEVDEEELPFRFSIMSSIGYFELTGKEATTIKTDKEAIDYFYCAYKAGCAYTKQEVKIQFEDWYNLVDDYPELIAELTRKFESSLKKK